MEIDTGSNIKSSSGVPALYKYATVGSSKLDTLKCTGCGGAIEIRGGIT